ncbi:hypothetical protein [Salinispira pacifica]|uniref:Uncharacterized protein n=1 Tax=Salinispira pacifica TaxID=1307761 RepID=V5WIP3_9SPIO|nr:hypothetical protein [Salinispira pacifica]AHC15011.1 hypothetical protein L21SP2_1626 [Salinispira pacifica]
MADENNAQDMDMDLELDELDDLDDELNEYGVFVKAGPEDVEDEPSDAQLQDLQEESSNAPDTSGEADESPADLSPDEEDLLGALEESGDYTEDDSFSLDDDPDFAIDDDSDDIPVKPDIQVSGDNGTAEESLSESESQALDDALNDLEGLEEEISLSLSDEDEEDQTIYLEEDEMKLDLDEQRDDVAFEEEETLDDIVIPDLDDDLDDITIPELDDEISIPDSNDEQQSGTHENEEPQHGGGESDLDVGNGDEALPGDLEPMDELEDDGSDDVLQEISLDEFMDKTQPTEDQPTEDQPTEDQTAEEQTHEEFSLDEEDLSFDMDSESSSAGDADSIEAFNAPEQDEDFLELDDDEDLLGSEVESDDIDIDLDEELLDFSGADDEAFSLDDTPGNDSDVDYTGSTEDELEDSSLPGAEDDVVSIEDLPDSDYSEDLDELEIDSEDSSSDEGEDFDDVAAFSDSLSEPEESEATETSMVDEAIRNSQEAEEGGNENQVLASIESELSAIKTELTDLRAELHRLRSGGAVAGAAAGAAAAAAASTTPGDEAKETEESPTAQIPSDEELHGGFFAGEDEDETIALTGDELDNILNTAEFTEESGQATASPDEDYSQTAFEDSSQDNNKVTEISIEGEEEDPFGGSDDELQAMAELDIEEELAGIDDLKDDSDDIQLYTGDELEDMELEIPEIGEEESPVDGEIEADGVDDTDIEDDFSDYSDSIAEAEAEESGAEEGLSADEEAMLMGEEEPESHMDLDLSEDEPVEELNLEEIEDAGTVSDEFSEPEALDIDQADENAPEPVQPDEHQLTTELKQELKAVLTYMDSLLENLPEEKIEEFAQSEHFATYQKLFEDLGL